MLMQITVPMTQVTSLAWTSCLLLLMLSDTVLIRNAGILQAKTLEHSHELYKQVKKAEDNLSDRFRPALQGGCRQSLPSRKRSATLDTDMY